MSQDLLWPTYDGPGDLAAIEAVPLERRGLPSTTYHIVQRAADLWPGQTALSVLPGAAEWREPSELTFGDLLDSVNRVANALHGLGIRRGNAVGLLSPNCAELVTSTLAAQLAGIAAPVNPGLNSAHVRQLLERSGARVLVAAGPELSTTVWEVALDLARNGVVDAVLALRPTGAMGEAPILAEIPGACVAYLMESAATAPGDAFVGTPPEAHDLAAVFHTGGTTGVPKLAAHSHANEVTDAWMVAANTVLDDRSILFAGLPLFHVNALVVTLLAPLMRGQQVVWAGPSGYRDVALFRQFWHIVEHFRISAMSAVPTVYHALSQVPVDADISSMRIAMVGASALPVAVREAFENSTSVPLLEGYGLTEATCASARSFTDHPRPGSVGQRFPYQHVKVMRSEPDGTWVELPRGEVGVLAISGPTVFPGYVTSHESGYPVLDGLDKIVDGWLDTGDLARVDDDGFIYLAGRAKDLIIRGGHNIDPTPIESALMDHPAVASAAAVGRPDTRAGEVPVAYVALTPGASATESELKKWAAERVAEHAAAPRNVHIVDALPETAVGKLYKLALRADAARRAVQDAFDTADVRATVDAGVVDGSILVDVAPDEGVDRDALRRLLDGFTLQWKLVEPT